MRLTPGEHSPLESCVEAAGWTPGVDPEATPASVAYGVNNFPGIPCLSCPVSHTCAQFSKSKIFLK